MESFIVDPINKNKTEYIIHNGSIKGDTLFIESLNVKNKKYSYIKKKLNFTTEASNW